MAVVPHLRVSWGGGLGFPLVDIWSNTVTLGSKGGEIPSEAELQTMVPVLAGQIANWFTSADARIATDASLTWVKAVWVLANGKQRDTNTAVYDFTELKQGAVQLPTIFEQTYALTWRTAKQRGRGHSGRIYPPLVAAPPVNGSPYCSVAQATGMAAAAAQLLSELSTASGSVLGSVARALIPVVISKSTDGSGLPAAVTPILGVVCDRVADIQHRRTNRIQRAEGALAALVL